MKVAIIGATGMVGSKIIEVLVERKVDAEYFLFSSPRNEGKIVKINGKNHKVMTLSPERIQNIRPDFALFAGGGDISEEWAPQFVDVGCVVIDNSSKFRMRDDVPLIVPEANWEMLGDMKGGGIVANPNCSTIAAVVPLKPLHDAFGLKRVIYSTYQAISGAGKNPSFAYPIENNLIPQIDVFRDDGYTKEEGKMIDETKKILGMPDLAVTATAVRVPIANVHCVSINASFEKPLSVKHVREVLSKAPGIIVHDNPSKMAYPMPMVADDLDEVFVGRIRMDDSVPNTVNFFIANDNIRKGAATNAVQILQLLLTQNV